MNQPKPNKKSKILVVGGGKLPFWKIILASVFYTFFIGICIMTFSGLYNNLNLISFLKTLRLNLIAFATVIPSALYFSTITTKYIDLENYKLIKEYRIGPFKKYTKRDINNLDYVQVINHGKFAGSEVRLWYQHRGHRKICLGYFDNNKKALEFGKYVAELIRIDLANNNGKGNTQWITFSETD